MTGQDPWADVKRERELREGVHAPGVFEWQRHLLASRDLDFKARAVGLALSTYGNADGSSIFPSQRRIARDLNVNRDTAGRAMRSLEAGGWLKVVRSVVGQPKEYRLSAPPGLGLAPSFDE